VDGQPYAHLTGWTHDEGSAGTVPGPDDPRAVPRGVRRGGGAAISSEVRADPGGDNDNRTSGGAMAHAVDEPAAPVAPKARPTRVPPPAEPASDYMRFASAFQKLYGEQTGGLRAVWPQRLEKVTKKLIREHGADECIRRARALFARHAGEERAPDLETFVERFGELG
jgi:hypothetical protein